MQASLWLQARQCYHNNHSTEGQDSNIQGLSILLNEWVHWAIHTILSIQPGGWNIQVLCFLPIIVWDSGSSGPFCPATFQLPGYLLDSDYWQHNINSISRWPRQVNHSRRNFENVQCSHSSGFHVFILSWWGRFPLTYGILGQNGGRQYQRQHKVAGHDNSLLHFLLTVQLQWWRVPQGPIVGEK